jgi:hypothetical protein
MPHQDFRPYKITSFRVGTLSGYTVEVSDAYGKIAQLPVKKGILTGKNRQFPTLEQAERALKRFEKLYYQS